MAESESSSPTLMQALGRLLETFTAIVGNRVELAAVELREEKARAIITLTIAGLALFSAMMVGVTLTACVVVVFWDHAAVTLGCFGAFYLCLALAGWQVLKRELDKPILPDTIAQLKKDSQCLQRPQ